MHLSGCKRKAVIPMYDKLIKRLRKTSIDFGESDHVSVMMIEAADAIEDLQGKAKVLEKLADYWCNKAPKWIPVTERLPKENGFYLCLYKHKASGGVAMDEGLSILQWINNKWGINDIYLVTHWMPLPQPPKDGEP